MDFEESPQKLAQEGRITERHSFVTVVNEWDIARDAPGEPSQPQPVGMSHEAVSLKEDGAPAIERARRFASAWRWLSEATAASRPVDIGGTECLARLAGAGVVVPVRRRRHVEPPFPSSSCTAPLLAVWHARPLMSIGACPAQAQRGGRRGSG